MSEEIEVEPGDVVHVADAEPDSDVDITDMSTAVDESVNVIVNVEVPEVEQVEIPAEPEGPSEVELLRQQVAELTALVMSAPAPEIEAEPEAEPEVDEIEVPDKDQPDETPDPEKEEQAAQRKRNRRFGRR